MYDNLEKNNECVVNDNKEIFHEVVFYSCILIAGISVLFSLFNKNPNLFLILVDMV